MPPVMLANQPMFCAWIDHDIEWLSNVLKPAEQFRAVKKEHVIVSHAVDEQEIAA